MDTIHPLEKEHLAAFRKDFQDKEAEINKYISVYLSALAVVTGWIIGPTSKNAITLFVGNNAYNLVLWFAIIFINIVFSTFLAYKGLIIHDIMQFVTYNAPANDGLLAWESWRRSKHSSTVRVRTMYTITIAAIPAVVALIIMGVLCYFLLQSPTTIMAWAKSGAADPATANPDLQQITRARLIGRVLWGIMVVLHGIPLRMFIESTRPTKRRWQELLALRPDTPRYETLTQQPFATTPAAGPTSTPLNATAQATTPAPSPSTPASTVTTETRDDPAPTAPAVPTPEPAAADPPAAVAPGAPNAIVTTDPTLAGPPQAPPDVVSRGEQAPSTQMNEEGKPK